MSTKATIVHSDDFHLYQECADDHNVYLRLDGDVDFNASSRSVCLTIPNHIWEAIRQFPATSFDLLDKTDEELEQEAKEQTEKTKNAPEFLKMSFSFESYLLTLKKHRALQAETRDKANAILGERNPREKTIDRIVQFIIGELLCAEKVMPPLNQREKLRGEVEKLI